MKKLFLENFRCFKTRQEIPFKPITLIYGANSSGKSSIIKSIMALKQTYDFKANPNEILIGNGEFVDIGSFSDYFNDTNKDFCIEQEFNYRESRRNAYTRFFKPKKLKIESVSIRYIYEIEKNKFFLKTIEIYAINQNKKTRLFVLKKNKSLKVASGFRVLKRNKSTSSNRHKYTNIYKISEVNSDFLIDIIKPDFEMSQFKNDILSNIKTVLSSIENNKDEFIFYHSERDICRLKKYKKFFEMQPNEARQMYKKEIESYIKNSYEFVLDNLLLMPMMPFEDADEDTIFDIKRFERIIIPRVSNEKDYVEYFGSMFSIDILNFVDSISTQMKNFLENVKYIGPLRKMPERYYSFTYSSYEYVGKSGENTANILAKNPVIKNRINKVLKQMEIGYQVRTKKLSEDLYYLALEDSNKRQVAINDVGFGISQILPVILQSFASIKETILIEQPEIHLHPKLQADLGELFCDACKETKNNFIIETHSETMMLRIQKLIRQGKIKADDVSVVYVDKLEDRSECILLNLNEKGEFERDWPNGFFDDAFRELL